MRKYAIIKNSVVIEVRDVADDAIVDLAQSNEMVIDITDITPTPSVGYILNGNRLEIPQGLTNREDFEIDLNNRKSEFGSLLAKDAANRIGARNKILDKSGAQVTSLLNNLIGIKALLETGALGTARSACTQLKAGFTEYSDIFDRVIDQINWFENNFGL